MVNKITSPITPLGEIDKINEIIDELDNIDPLPSQTGQSGKYLTTNGTVPSWAEVQSLPSQTGKAGKFLQTDGTDASWESAPFRNIGEIVASTIPLTDAGLHLLDGSLILGDGIYSAFVDYSASIYNASANYFCTEAEWQASVTQYGVCGKFVYDSINNTVRLPKYNSKIYTGGGTAPVVGNGRGLGITKGDVEGAIANYRENQATWSGLYLAKNYTLGHINTGAEQQLFNTGVQTFGITTDPTKSGIIAQLSDITTSLDGYYYIVIATSTKTDIQVDIDEIATDLNGKADVDLSNCTKPHIVETYVNGTSWYRVYSDGWCEQGGYAIKGSEGWLTISLLKNFVDTNYNLSVTPYTTNTSTYMAHEVKDKTISNFAAYMIVAIDWHACGYIR
jgi:hypothetical protein